MSVVHFPPPEKPLGYWTCKCGCMTHRVRSDGMVECAGCDNLASDLGHWNLPAGEPRDATAEDPELFKTIVHGIGFSRRRFAQRVESGEFIITIGLRSDGAVATCQADGGCQGREQHRWLLRRLREAYRMLVRGPV